jgi:hypothetical protein
MGSAIRSLSWLLMRWCSVGSTSWTVCLRMLQIWSAADLAMLRSSAHPKAAGVSEQIERALAIQ